MDSIRQGEVTEILVQKAPQVFRRVIGQVYLHCDPLQFYWAEKNPLFHCICCNYWQMCNKGKGGVDKPGSTETSFRQSPFCSNPLTTTISEKTAVLVNQSGNFFTETSWRRHRISETFCGREEVQHLGLPQKHWSYVINKIPFFFLG